MLTRDGAKEEEAEEEEQVEEQEEELPQVEEEVEELEEDLPHQTYNTVTLKLKMFSNYFFKFDFAKYYVKVLFVPHFSNV